MPALPNPSRISSCRDLRGTWSCRSVLRRGHDQRAGLLVLVTAENGSASSAGTVCASERVPAGRPRRPRRVEGIPWKASASPPHSADSPPTARTAIPRRHAARPPRRSGQARGPACFAQPGPAAARPGSRSGSRAEAAAARPPPARPQSTLAARAVHGTSTVSAQERGSGESQSGHRPAAEPPASRPSTSKAGVRPARVRHVRPSPAPSAAKRPWRVCKPPVVQARPGAALLPPARRRRAGPTPLFRAVLASWRWTRFSDARRCRTAQSAGSRGAAPAASPRRVPASRSAARSPARQAPEAAPWGRQARTGLRVRGEQVQGRPEGVPSPAR